MKLTSLNTYSPRRVLTLLGMGTAVSLLGDATLYTVLPNPSIASEVGISLGMVGVLLGANRAVRLLLNGPMGILYDRLPRRGLLVASLILGTLSNLSYALGIGFIPFLAGRIAWGVAWALLYIGGNAVVLDISTDQNRGKHSGQYQMWFFFGVAFSSFSGGLLTDLFGFRTTMWLTTAVIGGMALVWLLLFPETRPAALAAKPAAQQSTPSDNFPWNFVLQAGVPVFASRFVDWGVMAATGILWISAFIGDGIKIAGIYIPLATFTGSFTALTMLASIGGAPAAGYLSDKLGKRWGVLAVSALIGALGIWMMSTPWIAIALIGAVLAKITGGSVESLVPALAGDQIEKPAQGRVLGMIYTFGDLGSTLGPPVALGLLNAESLSLTEIYQLCVLAYLLVMGFAIRQQNKSNIAKT
ncbi:MAG: MFS transporter [Chloroflexota bacterium]